MGYKLSKEIKYTFILNLLLFSMATILNDEVGIATSVIIFVILSVSVQILEEIHNVSSAYFHNIRLTENYKC